MSASLNHAHVPKNHTFISDVDFISIPSLSSPASIESNLRFTACDPMIQNTNDECELSGRRRCVIQKLVDVDRPTIVVE